MKSSRIRRIACYLALFQMFSTHALADSNNGNFSNIVETPKTKITMQLPIDSKVIYSIQDGRLIYQRSTDGVITPLSIFDIDNIRTNQYGASQIDFNQRFDYLIKEQKMWQEVQNKFPLRDFDDYQDAMDFYRDYFNQIGACGCGYAAATNTIFQIFEGNETGFQNTFGFPMYSLLKDTPDYNYELMMLKFFQFRNIEKAENPELVKEFFKRNYYKWKVQHLEEELEAYRDEARPVFKTWSKEQYKEWKIHADELVNRIDEYNKKIEIIKENFPSFIQENYLESKIENLKEELESHKKTEEKLSANWSKKQKDKWKAEEKDLNKEIDKYTKELNELREELPGFAIPVDKSFGAFNEFLSQFGIQIKSSLKQYAKKFKVGDIVATGGTDLLRLDKDGNVIEKVNISSHYIYVTEITKDGKIIVSSWGNRFQYNNKDADWASIISIQLVKK